LSVDVVNCPNCGKETFNRKFCIFCGENIETTQNHKSNETSKSETNENNHSNLKELHESWKKLVKLKKKYEQELEEFYAQCLKHKIEKESKLAVLEKEKNETSKKLEELNVLHSLEEVSENSFKEKSAVLNQKLLQNNKDIEDTQTQLKELKIIMQKLSKLTVKKLTGHKSIDKKRIEKKLKELKSAYKDEKIGKELYTKLKSKYEKELRNPT